MSKDIRVLISNNVKSNVRKNIYTAIDYCIFFFYVVKIQFFLIIFMI